jgi:rod shape determining protein RodA
MWLASLKRQNVWLYGACVVLAIASLTSIWSSRPGLVKAQSFWFLAALVIILILGSLDLRPVMSYRWAIFGVYFLSLLLLIAAFFFAPVIRETRSWLAIGPLRFQPAEFSKIALIILLAYFLSRRHNRIGQTANIAVSFIYTLIPTIFILLQPDWGSALVMFGLWVGFLFVSGVQARHIVMGFGIALIVACVAWFFILAPYQKERMIGFLKPAYDPLGINYSVIQSKIAIGSGGIWGKGFQQGTQTQLGFLTEPATDFIFAALVEEWGIAGAFVVLGAFMLLIVSVVRIGLRLEYPLSQFVCLGAVVLFLVEFALNVGSNIGFVPVVGVTFPFVSYGGSSLLTKAMLIGIIQSIAARSSF